MAKARPDADLSALVRDLLERVDELEGLLEEHERRWRTLASFHEMTSGAAGALIRRLRDTS